MYVLKIYVKIKIKQKIKLLNLELINIFPGSTREQMFLLDSCRGRHIARIWL